MVSSIVDMSISVLQNQKSVAQQYISQKKNVEKWTGMVNVCNEMISMLKHNTSISPNTLEETFKDMVKSAKKLAKRKKGVTPEEKYKAIGTIDVVSMLLERFF